MKLKTLSYALLLAIATAGTVTAHAGETASSTNASAELQSYSRNLLAILDAEYLFEFITKPRPVAVGDFEQQFEAAFRAQATREEFAKRLMPVLAREIPPLLAAQLERQMNNAVYRKRGLNNLAKANDAASIDYFTDQEMRLLRAIDEHPAIKQYVALQPKLRSAIMEAIGRWSVDFAAHMNGMAADAMQQVEKDLIAAREANDGRTIALRSIGFAPWDHIIQAYGQFAIKYTGIFQRQDAELKRLNYAQFLRPLYLADKQHLDQAPGIIDKAESILESTVMQLNAAVKEREEMVAQSSMVKIPQFKKKYEDAIAGLYAFVGDYGEAGRMQLAQHRQFVSFMQVHRENMAVQDGLLEFRDKETHAQALAIAGRLEAAQQRMDALIANRENLDNEAMNKLRALSKPKG